MNRHMDNATSSAAPVATARDSQFEKLLYQNMPMGYFQLRIDLAEDGETVIDYEYLDVNPKFTQMLGLPREQIVGKKHTEIGPIFVNKLDLQILKRVAYEGYSHQTRGQFRNDGRYYNTTIYSPQQGAVVALFTDVTELVQTTEALQKSETEIKKVYSGIPVGIEVYDKEGYMIDVNQKDLDILHISDESVLLGRSLFANPSLPEYARDMLLDGKDVTFDVNIDAERLVRQRRYYGAETAGQKKYLTIKCSVIHNAAGEVENYLAIVIDNTEIYETSSRLREFESAFNAVAEIAEVGFFRWDILRQTYFNSDQWYRNMGFNNPENAHLSFEDYRHMIHPDDLVTLDNFLENALKNKDKEEIRCEFRVRNGQGWKWLSTAAYVTEYDPENQILQIFGINFNVNQIKESEVKLLEAKAKAEEADRMKSAFLANMSHEIRTPLNAIVGFSALLAETDEEEEKQEYNSIIQKNNNLLLSLISDILDLSKIESGDIELQMEDWSAEELCAQVLSSFKLRVPAGVELKVIPPEDTSNIVIHSDIQRLIQVLSNFIGNAIKFTTEGHIWLKYKEIGDQIEFSVEDTGVGMDPETAPSVFERFVKLNSFVQGTGLGLSICKSIIERMDGRIGVESQKGVGSRFWFTVPRNGVL